MGLRRGKASGPTGQALVELALVLPVLLLLLLGILEFGRVYLEYLGLNYAANHTAQAAARLGGPGPGTDTVLAAQALPPLDVSRVNLAWTILDPDGNVQCSGPTCQCEYGQLVQLTAQYPTQVQILGFREHWYLSVSLALFCWQGGAP